MQIYSNEFLRSVSASRSRGVEGRHFVFGAHELTNAPAYVPKKFIGENGLITGAAGSGKSAFIARLAETCIARGDTSVIVEDMKARDMALLGSTLGGAQLAAKPLRVRGLINEVGLATHTMNIMRMRHFKRLTPLEKASTIGKLLGTTDNMASRELRWWDTSAHTCLTECFDRWPDIPSLNHLANRLESLIFAKKKDRRLHPKIVESGLQAWVDANRMGKIEALNVVDSPDNIDFSDFFETPALPRWP